MAHRDIHKELEQRYGRESDLTLNMMRRAISDLSVKDPRSLDIIYEAVMFYTGDWPEHEGWGSSDTRICVSSVRDALLAQEHMLASALTNPTGRV